jgi:hypothetical protein
MRTLRTTPSSDSSSLRSFCLCQSGSVLRWPERGGVWRRGSEFPHVVSCMNSYIKWTYIFYEFSEFIHYLAIDILWIHLFFNLQKQLKNSWIQRCLAKFLVLQRMYLGHKGHCQKSPLKFISEKQKLVLQRYYYTYGTYYLAKVWHKTHELQHTNTDSGIQKGDN